MPTDGPNSGGRSGGRLTASPPRVADALRERARRLVEELDLPVDPRVARELLEAALGLLADDPDPLDLKIAAAAMTEMREAFTVFAPYRHIPKVTVFGSARTAAHDPVYEQAQRIAEALAERGWMVVTGAGPGIMQAAMEGAGRARSIGVAIRLPFEQGANPVIAGDEKYVSMKYFFTRKLMLVKESRAFVCLPGGFGTLDETFELLTLTQTGKGLPVPIVLLDPPHDPFWKRIDEMIHELLVSRDLVSPSDTKLYFVTDSVEEACAEIDRFYANYHSIRYVGDQAVIRLRHEPTDEVMAELNEDFRRSRLARAVRPHRPVGHRAAPRRPRRAAAGALLVRQAPRQRSAVPDRRPQPGRRADARSRKRPRSGRRGRRRGSVPADLTEQVGRLLDGAAGLDERLVGGRSGDLSVGDSLLQDVERQLVELVTDRLEALGELVVSGHGSSASATMSTGWRTSSPAAARCMAQPGLALATVVAPERAVARAIAASLRSRTIPASSGCSAE